jgi:hypothetical protein
MPTFSGANVGDAAKSRKSNEEMGPWMLLYAGEDEEEEEKEAQVALALYTGGATKVVIVKRAEGGTCRLISPTAAQLSRSPCESQRHTAMQPCRHQPFRLACHRLRQIVSRTHII